MRLRRIEEAAAPPGAFRGVSMAAFPFHFPDPK
jgi:hypothetical protein